MDLKDNEQLKKISEDLVEKFSKLKREDLMEEVVLGNSLEFEYENQKYKVTKPNFAKKQRAFQEKARKFTALLQNKELLLEQDLRKNYKERGVDIDALDNRFSELQLQKHSLQLKLGGALAKQNTPETELNEYKTQIEKILTEQSGISVQKSALLEFCIEQQVYVHICSYLTYLVTEKLVNDKWVPAWSNFEEFENSDEKLIQQVAFYSSLVIKDEIPE
jgi:hypothetical protein